MPNKIIQTPRSALRVRLAERDANTSLTKGWTNSTTSVRPTTESTIVQTGTGESVQSAETPVVGTSLTSTHCPRCQNGMILGRYVEDTSCVTCGYAPPTPEDDGWVNYLELMETKLNKNGWVIGKHEPHGKVW